jgi:hypothetical protein
MLIYLAGLTSNLEPRGVGHGAGIAFVDGHDYALDRMTASRQAPEEAQSGEYQIGEV